MECKKGNKELLIKDFGITKPPREALVKFLQALIKDVENIDLNIEPEFYPFTRKPEGFTYRIKHDTDKLPKLD